MNATLVGVHGVHQPGNGTAYYWIWTEDPHQGRGHHLLIWVAEGIVMQVPPGAPAEWIKGDLYRRYKKRILAGDRDALLNLARTLDQKAAATADERRRSA